MQNQQKHDHTVWYLEKLLKKEIKTKFNITIPSFEIKKND